MTSRQSIVFQLFMLFAPFSVYQCQQPPTVKEAPVVLDKNPEFKGGLKAMFNYVSNNLKCPRREKDIEGTVYIHFMVETDGQIKDVKAVRGIGIEYNEEAIRVVKSMSGMWESGLNQGVKERMPFTLPVKFKLE